MLQNSRSLLLDSDHYNLLSTIPSLVSLKNKEIFAARCDSHWPVRNNLLVEKNDRPLLIRLTLVKFDKTVTHRKLRAMSCRSRSYSRVNSKKVRYNVSTENYKKSMAVAQQTLLSYYNHRTINHRTPLGWDLLEHAIIGTRAVIAIPHWLQKITKISKHAY